MQTHLFSAELMPHPSFAPGSVSTVSARIIGRDENWLRLRWRIEGAQDLVVPPFGGRGRADELWKTTCFECFLRSPGSESYVELNLSPSERWAAYSFAGYRAGMAEHPMAREPDCTMRLGSSFAIFDAAVPIQDLPPLPWQIGMSAVIEEQAGTKSYWALAHAEGEPDFHNPACFAAVLAPPEPA